MDATDLHGTTGVSQILEDYMTHFRKLTAATAILSVSTLMSTAAFAETGDMTCGDFNAMDADGQMEAAMTFGQEAQEEAGRGADAVDEGVGTEMSDSTTAAEEATSGKQGQQNMGRGTDMMAAMVEHCKGGDDLMVRDTPSPAQRGADVE